MQLADPHISVIVSQLMFWSRYFISLCGHNIAEAFTSFFWQERDEGVKVSHGQASRFHSTEQFAWKRRDCGRYRTSSVFIKSKSLSTHGATVHKGN